MNNSRRRLSLKEQLKVIEGIKSAEVGAVLFQQSQSDDGGIFSMLINLSGVTYVKKVVEKGMLQYVKEA